MTLGQLKDEGLMPSAYQVNILEIEESRKCRGHGPSPHRYHVSASYSGRISRETCWQIRALWHSLERMFPGIEIDKR
jgi:hypothetical protein